MNPSLPPNITEWQEKPQMNCISANPITLIQSGEHSISSKEKSVTCKSKLKLRYRRVFSHSSFKEPALPLAFHFYRTRFKLGPKIQSRKFLDKFRVWGGFVDSRQCASNAEFPIWFRGNHLMVN